MKTIFKSATIIVGILVLSLASCERYDMIDNIVPGQWLPLSIGSYRPTA